jgi:Holliday junction resolvase RusA-like endonuclease
MAPRTEPNPDCGAGDQPSPAAAEAREGRPQVKFALPVAPTSNNAWSNRKGGHGYGRVRSSKYRRWLAQADRWYMVQHLGRLPKISPPFRCHLEFPRLRGDLDGRIKLILDYLVSRKITPDDRHCCELRVTYGSQTDMMVWIELWEGAK